MIPDTPSDLAKSSSSPRSSWAARNVAEPLTGQAHSSRNPDLNENRSKPVCRLDGKVVHEEFAGSRRRQMARNKLAVVGHVAPPASAAPMSVPYGLAALAALGQPTRLEIFRLLMRHEPDGLPAGAIADLIGCPQNTVSSHLAILARAQLTSGQRAGRSIIYRPDVKGMRALMAFLVSDCCDGHPQLCNLPKALRARRSRGNPPRKTRACRK